jgi:ParB/RepB/Spo0J family partition protein
MTIFAIPRLDAIAPSRTNPRKTFDAAKLAELTASIQASGVHQPVLLRPLPASRLEDTAGLNPRPEYELVAGERRYRASKAAGLQTIPAMVRELTDDEALEIQVVENLQRDDLTELEEAEGYETLMQHSQLNAEQVGAKIGKSRSYVYARIKLLDLCQEARTSLRDGTVDASRALVVARIPDQKLQIKAMKEIVQGEGYGSDREPMTYRQALDHVQRNYMLKLSDAKFKINCVDLVPEAGGCMSCAKRTGHDPDLFSDVKGTDICTDPPCFQKKTNAHSATLVAEAKAKGQTVIIGREAAELRGNGYTDKIVGYRRLDSVEDSPTDQPLRKIIGTLMQSEGITPTMIEHARRADELVACLPNEVALKLLKMAEAQSKDSPKVSKEVQQLVNNKKAKAEEKAKAKFEQGWRDVLVKDTWREAHLEKVIFFNNDLHRYLVVRAVNSLSTANAEALCTLLELGKVSPIFALIDYAKETAAPDDLHALIIMQEASSAYEHGYNGKANEGLLLVAQHVWGDKMSEIVQSIKIDVQAQVWPDKPHKAPTPTAPAAQAIGGGGVGKKEKAALRAPKPKLHAEAAMQGIAAAMQQEEEAREINLGATAQSNEVSGQPAGGVDTELLSKAVAVIQRDQKATVRLLKTELGIGTTKALQLMTQLEDAGHVGPTDERGARKVLVAA